MDIRRVSCRSGAHAGGTVSFKLFNNKSCDASEGGLIASDGPVAVDGNGEYATPHGASRSQAHTSDLQAPHSVVPNNKHADSGCADEPVKIGPATPTVETTPAPPSGFFFNDTATTEIYTLSLHDALPISVSFKLFNNKSCDASEGGLIASDGPVAVDGNGEYATPHGAS